MNVLQTGLGLVIGTGVVSSTQTKYLTPYLCSESTVGDGTQTLSLLPGGRLPMGMFRVPEPSPDSIEASASCFALLR
jgi:hypothetical protein